MKHNIDIFEGAPEIHVHYHMGGAEPVAETCPTRVKKVTGKIQTFRDSTAIKAVRWTIQCEQESSKLCGVAEVFFMSGAVYKYERVHESLVEEWLNVKSAGRFYQDWVRGNFRSYRQVEGPHPSTIRWERVSER